MQEIIETTCVKLPLDFSIKRDLRSHTRHTDGARLEEYDLAQYDDDTVFYDVFFDAGNRFLCTVGPPFLNLKKYLFPITYQINNDNRKYELKIEEYLGELIAIGKIPFKTLPANEEIIIEFDFNRRFRWRGRIKLNRFNMNPVILTTIQKDNRIRWIKEWAEFYSRNYKTDQTIIYDNNSSNRDELKAISGDGLLIVAWDYKYGPIRSHKNQFCQIGSLNHCRLKFGLKNIIMNFDIDELLFLKKPEMRNCFSRYNLMLFDGYRVPFIKPLSDDYSYKDFSFRDPDPQGGGRKYFYNPSNVVVNNIHSALLKRSQSGLYRRLETFYYKASGSKRKGRIYSCLLKLISSALKLKVAHTDEAYFLHYTGITNNWKSIYWNRKEEISRSDRLVRFDLPNM